MNIKKPHAHSFFIGASRIPEMPPNPMLVHRTFDDFDELAVEANNWDLDLQQLDRGRFEGELLQASTGNMLFTEARFGRTLDQKGSAPAGMRTVAVPAGEDVRFQWRKKTITGNDLLVFPRSGELESISHPDFHVFILSVPEWLLEDSLDMADGCQMSELLQTEAVSCSPTKMAILRTKLQALSLAAKGLNPVLASANVHRELEHEIPRLFVAAILGSRLFQSRATSRQRHLAVERAKGYIAHNSSKPLTVREVCQAAVVSERALQYAFLEHFGVTPKAYLKAIRLNGVRRGLKDAGPDATVTQVALRWGFWHMSQFAVDYRKHFGELPSHTLRQANKSR